MAKIESLTPTQEARFAEFVQKWTSIGLSTAPADRPRAERAVRAMYRIAGLDEPKLIVWCGSPLSMAITRAILLKSPEVGASIRDSVGYSVRASVWDSVWDAIRDSVGDSVRASVWDSVWDAVHGQHDANWLAFYDFFHQAIGLRQETQRLDGLWEFAQSAGWAIPCRAVLQAQQVAAVKSMAYSAAPQSAVQLQTQVDLKTALIEAGQAVAKFRQPQTDGIYTAEAMVVDDKLGQVAAYIDMPFDAYKTAENGMDYIAAYLAGDPTWPPRKITAPPISAAPPIPIPYH